MSELLECPDCDGRSFKWRSEVVQHGNVHLFDDGAIDLEALETGTVAPGTIDGNVTCNVCQKTHEISKLIDNE